MLIDLEVLKQVGTSDESLRAFFTAKAPESTMEEGPEKEEARKRWERRRKYEDQLSNELCQNIHWNLRHYHHYMAVDLAWDTPVITGEMVPLVLLAQRKINVKQCANQLNRLACAPDFVKKDDKGELQLDLPKFFETPANLMRSYLNRRVAAQANKFNNLWPYYKFESRSQSPVSKMRADLFSQRVDIMADEYNWRHHDTQCYRDALMYGWTVDFPRARWDRDLHWVSLPRVEGGDLEWSDKVAREGLAWVRPHPSRVYYDLSAPLADVNCDIGPEYVGFWDVWRYGTLQGEPKYWNRKEIGFSTQYLDLFTTFSQYFSSYYTTVTPPTQINGYVPGQLNDRKAHIGRYTDSHGDAAVVVSVHYKKIVPKDWGIGDYPYPVWVRHVVAGFDTVIHAEFLGTSPGAYLGINQKDDRLLSPGMGHDLLPLQDQMSNLLTYLLLALQSDNIKVLVLDIDTMSTEEVAEVRRKAKGNEFYSGTTVLEVSRKKLADLGLKVDDVVQLVETKSSTQLNLIFQAMLNLLQLAERMIALSPQEMGQPAPREISATETNMIAGTTESVYNSISDSIDEWRAAKKRIVYESYVNHAMPDFVLPAVNRYEQSTIDRAGLELADDLDLEDFGNGLVRGNILGPKSKLLSFPQIFTSRDGAERTSNIQAAGALSEVMKAVLPLPTVQETMTKGQLIEVLNEYFRLTGAFNMRLDADPTTTDEPVSPAASEQLEAVLKQLVEKVGEHDQILTNANQAVPPPGPGQ